jgi:hypothetical protein
MILHDSSLAVACYDSGSQAKFLKDAWGAWEFEPQMAAQKYELQRAQLCSTGNMSGASRRNSSRGPFKALYPPFWDQYIHQLVMAQSFAVLSEQSCHTASKNLQVPSEKTS